MKNKKAFTLIEILGVLVIISMLFVVLYPSIKKTMRYSKNTTYDTQINNILKTSYDYTLNHPEALPDTNGTLLITLADLKADGLINTNIVDPKTNNPFSDDLIINVRKSSCSENAICYKNGSYSYTINLNNSGSKPVITLSSNDVTVSYGGTYIDPTVTKPNGYSIIRVVTKDNKVVESINTNQYGIYYVSYTIKNSSSAANAIAKVAIMDINSPDICFSPELSICNKGNETVSLTLSSVESYNLMNGVSCTDNDKCEIIVEGSIKPKVGTYTIKYTAKDPSGNVSDSVYRLIKVE